MSDLLASTRKSRCNGGLLPRLCERRGPEQISVGVEVANACCAVLEPLGFAKQRPVPEGTHQDARRAPLSVDTRMLIDVGAVDRTHPFAERNASNRRTGPPPLDSRGKSPSSMRRRSLSLDERRHLAALAATTQPSREVRSGGHPEPSRDSGTIPLQSFSACSGTTPSSLCMRSGSEIRASAGTTNIGRSRACATALGQGLREAVGIGPPLCVFACCSMIGADIRSGCGQIGTGRSEHAACDRSHL